METFILCTIHMILNMKLDNYYYYIKAYIINEKNSIIKMDELTNKKNNSSIIEFFNNPCKNINVVEKWIFT